MKTTSVHLLITAFLLIQSCRGDKNSDTTSDQPTGDPEKAISLFPDSLGNITHSDVKARVSEMGYGLSFSTDGYITQLGANMPKPGAYKVSLWDMDYDTVIVSANINQSTAKKAYQNIPEIKTFSHKRYAVSVSSKNEYYKSKDTVNLPLKGANFSIDYAAYNLEAGEIPNTLSSQFLYGYPDVVFKESKKQFSRTNLYHITPVPANVFKGSCGDFVKAMQSGLLKPKDAQGKTPDKFSGQDPTQKPEPRVSFAYRPIAWEPVLNSKTDLYHCECKHQNEWFRGMDACMAGCYNGKPTTQCMGGYCEEVVKGFWKVPVRFEVSIKPTLYALTWEDASETKACKDEREAYLTRVLEHEVRHIEEGLKKVKELTEKFNKQKVRITGPPSDVQKKVNELWAELNKEIEKALYDLDAGIDKEKLLPDCSKCE